MVRTGRRPNRTRRGRKAKRVFVVIPSPSQLPSPYPRSRSRSRSSGRSSGRNSIRTRRVAATTAPNPSSGPFWFNSGQPVGARQQDLARQLADELARVNRRELEQLHDIWRRASSTASR
jgi:hypothetical protein